MKIKMNNNSFKYIILMFITILSVEIILKYNINNLNLNSSFLRVITLALITSLIFNLILIFVKNKTRTMLIFVFLFTVYSWFQINLYNYLGFFMSFSNSNQGAKVVSFYKEFLSSSTTRSILLFLPFILLFIYMKFIDQNLKKIIYNYVNDYKIVKINNSKIITYSLFLIIILNVFYFDLINNEKFQNNLQMISNKTLFLYSDNNNMIVNQFGILGFTISDVINPFIKQESIDAEFGEIVVKDNNRDIDDTIFKEIIDSEDNDFYNSINKYIINREIEPKNESTGIFKDKNLIVILVESINDIAINKYLFPNMYKLVNEGLYYENNYSPRNECSTGNNELTVMTSLHTINKVCNYNNYKDNTYFHSLFNKFRENGYKTNSFHNYVEFYYSRRVTHRNLGSESYENAYDLNIPWSSRYKEWPSDVDLIEKAYPKLDTSEKFLTFLTTVTTHQPYSVDSVYGNKYLDELKEYDYSLSIKRYMSKIMELDSAIGLLFEKLENDDILDDTVIVLFSDHYPYGLSDDDLTSTLGYDVSEDMLVDKVPFLIYNSELEGKVIDDYTSLVNVLPTLFNLFDIEYDPRLYFGIDLFGERDKRAIFADASWVDKKGYFNSNTNKFKEYIDNSYTDEEIIEINKSITLEKEMSSHMIRSNYFDYLNKEKNERKDD